MSLQSTCDCQYTLLTLTEQTGVDIGGLYSSSFFNHYYLKGLLVALLIDGRLCFSLGLEQGGLGYVKHFDMMFRSGSLKFFQVRNII